MPKYFKTLASICIWILFVSGCAGVLVSLVLDVARKPESILTWAVSLTAILFTVIAIKMRNTL